MNPIRGRAARGGTGLFLLAAIVAATAGPAAPEERADGRMRRFQIEIYGGIGRPGLSDINSLVAAGDAVQEFGYDRLLDYKRQAGLVRRASGCPSCFSGAVVSIHSEKPRRQDADRPAAPSFPAVPNAPDAP